MVSLLMLGWLNYRVGEEKKEGELLMMSSKSSDSIIFKSAVELKLSIESLSLIFEMAYLIRLTFSS